MSKTNGYATNKGGMIKAPHPVKGEPKSSVITGKGDLRSGKK